MRSVCLRLHGTDSAAESALGMPDCLPNVKGISDAGNDSSGQIDINDGGTAAPRARFTGTYSMPNGVGTIQLRVQPLGRVTYNFKLYAAFGLTNGTNPLTLYAVSTDAAATRKCRAILFSRIPKVRPTMTPR